MGDIDGADVGLLDGEFEGARDGESGLISGGELDC